MLRQNFVAHISSALAPSLLHHAQELFVVYESILILVHLANHLVDLLIRERLILTLQALAKLISRYSAGVVLVEVAEGLLDLPLFGIILTVHARRDELRVVDDAVVV